MNEHFQELYKTEYLSYEAEWVVIGPGIYIKTDENEYLANQVAASLNAVYYFGQTNQIKLQSPEV